MAKTPFDPSEFMQKIHSIAMEHRTKLIYQSFCLADLDERKARLRAVMELSVELQNIKDVDRFSTGLGEAPIESIIEGNWQGAGIWVEHFTFKAEGPEIEARYGPLWERFRVILHASIVEARRRAQSPASESRGKGN